MKRIIFITLGVLCVGLAMAGMVLPLLPTTPFLLLALWLFLRSSPRLARWLLTNKFCGEYLDNYRRGRGIPLRVKVFVTSLLWLSIGFTSIFVIDILWLRLLLLAIATTVTYHILTFPTLKK
ncbi:MAG: YbaN family protein [Rikenellaceae bacterium]